MSRASLCLAAFLSVVTWQTASGQFVQTIPFGSSLKGSVDSPGGGKSWLAEAVGGTLATVKIKGKKGLIPAVEIQDLTTGQFLTVPAATGNKVVAKKLLLPTTGAYRIRVTGAGGTTGTFSGGTSAKVPKTATSIQPSGTLSSGQSLPFDGVSGARISGKFKVVSGTVTTPSALLLLGPTGTVDIAGSIAILKKGKAFKLKKTALPAVGPYALLIAGENIAVTAKLKIAFPKGKKKKGAVVLSSPAIPQLDPVVSPTSSDSVEIAGTAQKQFSTILVLGGPAAATTTAGADFRFSVSADLFPDAVNHLFVVEVDVNGVSGPGAPVTVIHDATPPELHVDFPSESEVVSVPEVTVAGRVSDRLSGFMGLTVSVNGIEADVDVGIGTNGTYEARGVPLAPNELTELVVTASDVLGNQIVETGSVVYIPSAGADIRAVSGINQKGKVNSVLKKALKVKVFDVDGKPYADKLVTFEVIKSDGILFDKKGKKKSAIGASIQVFTDKKGVAKAFFQLGSDSGCGNNRVRATAAGMPSVAYFCATAVPASAAQVNLASGGNQRAQAGGPLPQPLRVWVNDGRNGCVGQKVTYELLRGDGYLVAGGKSGGEVSTTSSHTGHAEAFLVVGEHGGEQVVEARIKGAAGGVRFVAQAIPAGEEEDTGFRGVVLDNGHLPIGGAECKILVAGSTFSTLSGDDGRFSIDGLPVSGPAILRVNGSLATSVGGTPIASIPNLGFPDLSYDVLLIPGTVNELPTPVLLPALDLDPAAPNVAVFDNTADVVLTHPDVQGLEFRLIADPNAGHLHPDGTPIDQANPLTVSVHQVHTDDVPMPVPDGASPPFAWTLQPPGASFDPPIQVRYPNMSGLPPGAVTYFLSFDHDTRRFEIVATGSVSADGAFSVTDPESGISHTGWGCQCPPYDPVGQCENCGVQITSGGLQTVPACTEVTFTASGSPAPGFMSWSAPGAKPASGSGNTFTTTYEEGGDYEVTATWTTLDTSRTCSDSVDLSVAPLQDTPFDPTAADVQQVSPSAEAKTALGGAWGVNWIEGIDVQIAAIKEGSKWRAVMTGLTGQYSVQAVLVQGVDEVTGPPPGNSTQANFCKQVTDLKTIATASTADDVGNSMWYMLQAVVAHEQVHADKAEPAIEAAASQIEALIEAVTVNDTGGMTKAQAIAAIEKSAAWTTALEQGKQAYWAVFLNMIDCDHHGPTDIAEQAVVNPMIAAICAHASANSWGACATCPP